MKNIIIILLINLSLCSNKILADDTIIFSEKGKLVINKIKFFYEISIQGKFILTNEHLFFCPENKNYFKEIEISLSKITSINIRHVPLLFPRLIIKTENDEYYISLSKKTNDFSKSLDNIIKVKNENNNSNKFEKVITEKYILPLNEASIFINSYGSTFYTPLIIKGYMIVNEDGFNFHPTEYSQYIKTIKVKNDEIKKIKRNIIPHWLTFKLDSGLKYRIITSHRRNIINKTKKLNHQ